MAGIKEEPVMAMAPELYKELDRLQLTFRETRLPTSELPPPQAISKDFAFWFATQAFLLVQLWDAQEHTRTPIPSPLVQGMSRFGAAVRGILGLAVPDLNSRTSLPTASAWCSTMGAAVGGDNWCRDAKGNLIHMEIFRNQDPGAAELEMECRQRHLTRYDDSGAAGELVKV